MHTRSLFVYLCTLFAFVSLSTADIQKRSFSVSRVPNPNFTGRNGPRALVKAYRKFLMPLPDGLVAAMEAQDKKKGAQQAKRSPLKLREPKRRGLLSDLLSDLGLGGNTAGNAAGNQGGNRNNGNQGGNRNGNQGGNQVGNQNGGQGGNRNNGNGGQISTNTTSLATNQTGAVEAKPEKNEAEFISPVKIGGQMVNLDFDTGSSDLWVFSTQLNPALTNGHRVYDPSQSRTFRPMQGAQFRIKYGDGSQAVGNVGLDVVDVGGASFPQQAVQMATAVSDQFARDQNNDGLMGLAFSSINTVKPQQQRTFFDNVKGSLAEPVFTADLRKGSSGTYTFGSIDKSRFQGPLTWIPVNNTKGFWQFTSESFAVNGGQPQPASSGGQAIADTGTSLMLADPKMVMAYYAQVQGARNNAQMGGFTFPCNAQLPDLDVDVGGVYMAKVFGKDVNFAEVGNGECFGGVQVSPSPKFAIYGDIFFKSQFVVFNAGNNSLGMAPHA
ncbi:hypothetical protein ED733_000525 [Metarhizium rileyi]|uniref:Peptidase A1 domain-containing protein n=1 Tax=Metarhizium rileyi (strain RCEF 4871) TaxID=1649241 RepID=A0A5C6G8G9_METRR|nr:hypothetical protein ED733_000525 [Metarhizium rileyi]